MKKVLGIIGILGILAFLSFLGWLTSTNDQALIHISDIKFLNFQINSASVGTVFTSPSTSSEEVDDDEFFTMQPVDCTVYENEDLSFSVAFSFDGAPYKIQWQYRDKDSRTWFNSTAFSAQDNTLHYSASLKYTGRHYRCIIMNDSTGEEHVSRCALLTVLPG